MIGLRDRRSGGTLRPSSCKTESTNGSSKPSKTYNWASSCQSVLRMYLRMREFMSPMVLRTRPIGTKKEEMSCLEPSIGLSITRNERMTSSKSTTRTWSSFRSWLCLATQSTSPRCVTSMSGTDSWRDRYPSPSSHHVMKSSRWEWTTLTRTSQKLMSNNTTPSGSLSSTQARKASWPRSITVVWTNQLRCCRVIGSFILTRRRLCLMSQRPLIH